MAAEPLLEAVSALLATLPEARRVVRAHNFEATMQRVDALRPWIVVVDGDLPGGDVQTLVTTLKSRAAQTLCLVLADSVQQQRQLLRSGAEVVLLKGALPAHFTGEVEAMLTRPTALAPNPRPQSLHR